MKQLNYLIMSVLIVMITAVPVLAQSDEDVVGVVTGRIINQTDGEILPGEIDLMLHVWDQDFNEKTMLNGQSEADGTFQFDKVTINSEWLYAVMLTYQDVLYYSEPMPLSGDPELLTIDVPIYETTTDISKVIVERQHIFFDAAQGGLMVGEVYILSNLGDKTIAGTGGDDGTLSPLNFPLPEDAASVSFERDIDGRFLLAPTGFVDTAPLRPGQGSSQVVVRYILPYTDGMTYTYTAPWPVNELNFLVPESLGLSLAMDNLIDEGAQDMGNGEQIGIFSYGSLDPEESLSVTLSGALVSPSMALETEAQAAEPAPQTIPQTAIAIGVVLLGLALIGVGFWWYRRPDDESEEIDMPVVELNFKDLVRDIALLDDAHDRGEVGQEAYEQQRAALHNQAQVVLKQAEFAG